jgi:hypothetical protein
MAAAQLAAPSKRDGTVLSWGLLDLQARCLGCVERPLCIARVMQIGRPKPVWPTALGDSGMPLTFDSASVGPPESRSARVGDGARMLFRQMGVIGFATLILRVGL